jgi:hypothetical protein
MVDSPKSEASHDSGPGTGKNHAPKDKQCQYCHQHFTSSSLGRHLDQFIFRKKPDGIHSVEEIRRQRGGITRRTTKAGANAKQDREGSQPTPVTVSPVNHDSPAGELRADLNATPAEGFRVQLNAPNWQATGVINGLQGSSTVSPAFEKVMSTTGKRNYSSIETAAAKDILCLRGDLGSEKDTARALELALREVLDTIQAAQYVFSSVDITVIFSNKPSSASKQYPRPHPFQSTFNPTPFPRSSYTSCHHLPPSSPLPHHSRHQIPSLSLLHLTIPTLASCDPPSRP